MSAEGIAGVARVAVGVVAVLAQLALAFFYVGLPILVVPVPGMLFLWLLWVIQVVLVIWLAIRHTWYAPLVPLASFVMVMLMLEYGRANLGWGA
jgi:hypothetical protein